MIKRYIALVGTGLLVAATQAAAQVPLTARALGMGGAYLATARGYETLFLNPANLGLSGTPQWSVSFPQVTAGGTVLGPSVMEFSSLVQAAGDNGSAAGDSVIAKIPLSGTEAQFDVRAPLFALQIGHLAVGVNYGSVGQHTFGKDIVELLVNGYEDGRTNYSVGNTAGSRSTYWDVAAAYGRSFGILSLGVTGHYIHGGSAVQSRMFEPRIDVENRDITVNYVSVLARGGSGYAVDFGAALQPLPGVTVSAALANAASSMKWSEDLRVRDYTLERSTLDTMSVLNLLMDYEASEQALDPTSATVRVLETARGLYDEAYFPAEARVGLDWSPFARTNIGAAYHTHVTGGRLSGRWTRTAGVGIQQKLPLITVRAGYATNLEEGTMISGGVSLGPIQVGVAKLQDGMFDGASRSGWMGTFGLGVRTREPLQ